MTIAAKGVRHYVAKYVKEQIGALAMREKAEATEVFGQKPTPE